MAEFIPSSYDEETSEATQGRIHEASEAMQGRIHVDKITSNGNRLTTTAVNKNKKMDKIMHYERVVDELFSSFRDSFEKNYKSSNEHEKRKDIFRHNMRF